MVNLVGCKRGRMENDIFPLIGVVEMRGMKNGWVEFSTRAHQKPSSQIERKKWRKNVSLIKFFIMPLLIIIFSILS